MDIAYCNEYMTEAIKDFLLYGVAFLCVLAILFFIAWILRIIAKDKLTKERRRQAIGAFILAIAIAGIYLFGFYIAPASKDLKNEDYIAVHGEFRHESGRRKGFPHTSSYIKPDGQDELIHLTFVTENSTDEEKFPMQIERTGTVIYARRSRIVLDFIPDS